MDQSTMTRVALVIVALVFLDALFVELRSIVREAKRIVARLDGYASLPIVALLEKSEGDVERITRALDAIPALLERADQAWTVVSSLGRVRPQPPAEG